MKFWSIRQPKFTGLPGRPLEFGWEHEYNRPRISGRKLLWLRWLCIDLEIHMGLRPSQLLTKYLAARDGLFIDDQTFNRLIVNMQEKMRRERKIPIPPQVEPISQETRNVADLPATAVRVTITETQIRGLLHKAGGN